MGSYRYKTSRSVYGISSRDGSNTRPSSAVLGKKTGTTHDDNFMYTDSSISLFSGLANLVSKITGNHLTDADREANAFTSEQAEAMRTWNEEMYQKYGTISAQRQQWEDAGFNSAMAMSNGNSIQPAPSTSSSPSSVSPGNSSSLIGSLFSTIINGVLQKHQLAIADYNAETNRISAEAAANRDNAQAGLTEVNTRLAQIDEQYKALEKELNLQKNRAEIDNIIRDTEVKGTEIVVNGKRIELMDSQIGLNEAQVEKALSEINLNAWNAKKIEEMLPYQKAREEAEIKLANAKTATERADAKLKLEQANKTMVDAMISRRMLYSGIIENQAEESYQNALTSEARRKYLESETSINVEEERQARIDADASFLSVPAKVLKAYTVDLLVPTGSTTTTKYNTKNYDKNGKFTGTSEHIKESTTVNDYN